MTKLKIKLPKKVIVSWVEEDNDPYVRPFDIRFIGGDRNSGDLPNFRSLFEMGADKVKYATATYAKIEDIAGLETFSKARSERYRWSKMSGFSVEGQIMPVRELTYIRIAPSMAIGLDESLTESAKNERMRTSALECARQALPN
jgi:hypothetical protein